MDTNLASNINNALMVFIIFLCIGIMFLWILFLIFVHRASIEQWSYHDIWERTSKEAQDIDKREAKNKYKLLPTSVKQQLLNKY